MLQDGKMNVKEAILDLLANEWPLTIKQINRRLGKKYGLQVTYQAVYKTIKQLLSQEMLLQKKDAYELSLSWIQKQKRKIEALETNYLTKTGLFSKNKTSFQFETLYDFFNFIVDAIYRRRFAQIRLGTSIALFQHMWWFLAFEKENVDKLKAISSRSKTFILCRNDSKVDKWLKSLFLKAGVRKVRLNSGFVQGPDTLIQGEIIFQVFFSPELKKLIHETYEKTRNINDLIESGFLEKLFYKKGKINVLINRDLSLANQLREEALKEFK